MSRLAALRAAIAADPRPRVCCCGDVDGALWSPWAVHVDFGPVSSSFYDGVEAGWDDSDLPGDATNRREWERGHRVGLALRAEFQPRCEEPSAAHYMAAHSHQNRAEWLRWNRERA